MCCRTKSGKADNPAQSNEFEVDIPDKKKRGVFVSMFRSFHSRLKKKQKPVELTDNGEVQIDLKEITNHEYACKGLTGAGTFGVVYKACPIVDPKRTVAVKRIDLDDESETREVDVHKLARHQNVVALKNHWSQIVNHGKMKKTHIYMVMEYLPSTLEDLIMENIRHLTIIPLIMIKVFAFQMFRGLNYLHTIQILHRDIKPSNMLVSIHTGVLKICDFGCAKRLKRTGGTHRTYICSRYYRAPELVMKNFHNDENIDNWAAACVLAECFRGWPLFPGKTTRHQFGAIANVLGNPTPLELYYLNPKIKVIHVKLRDASGTFDEHFPSGTPESAMDLLAKMLVYPPAQRLSSLAACAEPYFDQLRLNVKTIVLPSGAPLPPLFNFSTQELQKAPPGFVQRLLPPTNGDPTLCYLVTPTREAKSPPSVKDRASIDSIATEAETEESEDVFSELDSPDVEEAEMWDCKKMHVVQDEE